MAGGWRLAGLCAKRTKVGGISLLCVRCFTEESFAAEWPSAMPSYQRWSSRVGMRKRRLRATASIREKRLARPVPFFAETARKGQNGQKESSGPARGGGRYPPPSFLGRCLCHLYFTFYP